MGDFKGVWIPSKVWECKELSLLEKCFLCKIKSLENGEGCTAGNAFFSEFFDISKSRCTQVLKELEVGEFIKIVLFRENKEIVKRVVNLLHRGIEFFNEGSEEIKQGIEFPKQGIEKIKEGYLENSEYKNRELRIEDKNRNKNENIPASEISILKIERMWHQEIETFVTYTSLHPELKTAVKFYLDDQEEKQKGGITTAMVRLTLQKVQGHLAKFDYKKVAVSLYDAVQKSNKDFNPAWNKTESTNQNTENGKVAVDWVMGKAKIQTGKV